MKEIGSEFWEIETAERENKLFPNDTKWFISGRSALNFIVEDILCERDVKKAWLPSWCCESMILPFLNHNIEVEFYPVYFKQGRLICEVPEDGEIVLIMNYFGYSQPIEVTGFSGIVIRDLTHSISSCVCQEADYAFGSLRKWTGISTGGFAISKKPWKKCEWIVSANKGYVDLKKKAMRNKAAYIHGMTDDKSYLEVYAKAEEILENAGIELAIEEDVKKANFLDIEYIADKRRQNANFLMSELQDFLLFDRLSDTDCPLFVPILTDHREELRHFLIENNVYCPVHWPVSKYHKLNCQTEDIYKRELSIICDQRYDLNHMEHMVKLIKRGMDLC